MPRFLTRAATALLALPLAATIGTATAAADEITVPGCYGVSVVVCDPTVDYGLPAGVETYSTQVPVCAGTCQYVKVTLVRTTSGETLGVCVSYETLSGGVVERCVPGADTDDLIATVGELIQRVVESVDPNQLGETLRDRICRTNVAAVRDAFNC